MTPDLSAIAHRATAEDKLDSLPPRILEAVERAAEARRREAETLVTVCGLAAVDLTQRTQRRGGE